jgi:hypothetical protein
MNKIPEEPKPPAGTIEIEGIGVFPADNVPEWAYKAQKILMYSVMVIGISPFVIIMLYLIIKKFN